MPLRSCFRKINVLIFFFFLHTHVLPRRLNYTSHNNHIRYFDQNMFTLFSLSACIVTLPRFFIQYSARHLKEEGVIFSFSTERVLLLNKCISYKLLSYKLIFSYFSVARALWLCCFVLIERAALQWRLTQNRNKLWAEIIIPLFTHRCYWRGNICSATFDRYQIS